ncbi:hypothetical protein M1466_00215 [Candidatus Dependentiae bacterium]|nr:hypothetical protein [Candidatus Dependentiae bacterium]
MMFLLQQIAIYTPLAIAAYLSISLMRIPNLAIESAFSIGAITASLALSWSSSGYWSLLLALSVAFIAGSITGICAALLHLRGYISHLLAGLITIGLVHGFLQVIAPTGQLMITKVATITSTMTDNIAFIIMGCCIIATIAFLSTQLGYAIAIYGNNPIFLRHYRINTAWVVSWGLALANGLAGIAGFLIAYRNGFADSTMGNGIILLALTILVLAKAINKKTEMHVLVPLLGTVAYFLLQFFLLKIGFDLRYFTAMQAFIIALILITNNRLQHKQEPDTDLGV